MALGSQAWPLGPQARWRWARSWSFWLLFFLGLLGDESAALEQALGA